MEPKKEKLAKAKAGNKASPPGGAGKPKSNLAGGPSCFHCGSEDHWQYKCPKLTPEDRAALLKIKEDRDAKRKGDKMNAQVSVVASRPAADVKKRMSFKGCL